jgi:alpha-D-xyloside xylohydrolase
MRALVMDFPKDKKVWDMNDEYMFGKAFLVAPVLEAQYTPEKVVKVDEQSGWNRDNAGKAEESMAGVDFTQKKSAKVYLPEGASWYDYWTNEKLEGGQEITRETTLDLIPLYIKAGSIVPLGPDVQYATEKRWDALTLCVYPGADGSFILYEDEFDNYNYEKGAYTEILMTWDESSRRLTIGSRKGSYPGMLESRKFIVRTPDGKEEIVNYTGKKVSVKL